MPWNRKTSRRDRKRRMRAQKREVFRISPTVTYRIRRRFKKITPDHLPLPPQPQFVIELFNLDGFEK